MSSTGKIARLPHLIREQTNQRLQDGHKAKSILPWLNALPEVQAILKAEFDSCPINAVNLTAWKQGGYCHWQARQHALEVVRSLEDEQPDGQASLTNSLSTKLARWAALHLAASAHSIAAEQDPKTKCARLHEFCADISRLRRGDLHAERLTIERERLALQSSNTDAQREKDFWKWTERPDIREKLFPDREAGLSPETLEKIEKELRLM